MNTDESTRAWLKKELVALLGFPEVDDILSYILTSFQAKEEVAPYLTELLGVPTSRAEAISSRLFATSGQSRNAAASGGGSASNQKKSAPQRQQQQATPLVPKPDAPNSRLKQTKAKKPSKLLHSRIINCLKCGKIEMNAARRCGFCDSELRYEELDDAAMDPAAQAHMELLVGYDESSAERTQVLDTEQYFYDEVENVQNGQDRHKQPVVFNLDLEKRAFTSVTTPSVVLTQNQELPKDARDLLQSIQKKLDKAGARKGARGAQASSGSNSDEAAVGPADELVIADDEYNALYV